MHRVWSGDDKTHKKVKWNIVRGADSMLCYCQRSKNFLQVLHERDESVSLSLTLIHFDHSLQLIKKNIQRKSVAGVKYLHTDV